VAAVDEAAARATVERLAGELLSNPLIEAYDVELVGGASSLTSAGGSGVEGVPAEIATPEGAST
jgi:hypothetical protein